MAIKRVYHRADFDSSLSEQDKLNFIDHQFTDCANNGVDGVIIGCGGEGVFILEGEQEVVEGQINKLVNAAELNANESILEEERSSGMGQLVSQTDDDPRNST